MEKFVKLKTDGHFSPSDIFDCGQSFRFRRIADDYYDGVAYSRYIKVRKSGDDIIIENTTDSDVSKIWNDYFDLKRNYAKIKKSFAGDMGFNYMRRKYDRTDNISYFRQSGHRRSR